MFCENLFGETKLRGFGFGFVFPTRNMKQYYIMTSAVTE